MHLDSKTIIASKIAAPLSVAVTLFEKYIFSDWQFLTFLVVVIAIDTVLGFGIAVWQKNVSSSGFNKLLKKMITYLALLVLGHALGNFTVQSEKVDPMLYLQILVYTGMMIREAISIVENLGKIDNRYVPTFILKRLKGFDEKGDYKELEGTATKSKSNAKADLDA